MFRTYCPVVAPAALSAVTVHGIRTAWLLIVMPRSRSMSMRSRYCARALRSSRTPVSCSMRSARVDLPWSMCAMMQKFRMIAGSVWPGCGASCWDTWRFLYDGWVRAGRRWRRRTVILPRGRCPPDSDAGCSDAVRLQELLRLGNGEAPALLQRRVRRDRDLVRVGEDVEEHRSVVGERLPDRIVHVVRVGDPYSVQPDGPRNRREVRVAQLGAVLGQPDLLHLELHHPEPTVVEDHQLDGQFVADRGD